VQNSANRQRFTRSTLLTALISITWLPVACAAGQAPAQSRPAATQQRQAGDFLYLSGQLGRDRVTGAQPEGIAEQTRLAMENIGQILKDAGMTHANLVKCHVYLDSMDDYTGMNKVYGSFFTERVPARTTVEAVGLPGGAGVQITCIAFRDLKRISVVRPPDGSLPAPLGPYSAAVWAGDTLFVSGMGGQFPEDRRLPEPLVEQVSQTLVNIRTTLDAAKLRFSDVVWGNVYLTEPKQAGDLSAPYGQPFATGVQPPGAMIFLPRLPGAIKTEITFVATRGGDRQVIKGDGPGGQPRGIRAGGVLYTRGESAPDAGRGFEEQFSAVLNRLTATVRDAGMQASDVASVQVYLADMGDHASMERLFQEAFPHGPARTVIQEMPGHGAARVQASLIAAR